MGGRRQGPVWTCRAIMERAYTQRKTIQEGMGGEEEVMNVGERERVSIREEEERM